MHYKPTIKKGCLQGATLENGTPQEGNLNPFLFNTLTENFAQLPPLSATDLFIFADDVAPVEAPTKSKTCNVLFTLQYQNPLNWESK